MRNCFNQTSNLNLIFLIVLFLFLSCNKDKDKPDNEKIRYSEKITIAKNANELYLEFLAYNSPVKSRELLITELQKNEFITDVKLCPDSTSIWWEYSNSAHMFITDTSDMNSDTTLGKYSKIKKSEYQDSFYKDGSHLSNTIGPHNKQVLLLSPCQYDWTIFGYDDHLITEYLFDILPEFDYYPTYKVNRNKSEQNISLDDFKNFRNYGIIVVLSHGAISGDFMNTLATGVKVSEELDNLYSYELDNHHLITSSTVGSNLIMYHCTPLWFQNCEKKDNTLVFFSICYGASNVAISLGPEVITENNSVYMSWSNKSRPFFTSEYDRYYFDRLLYYKDNQNQATNNLNENMGCYNFPFPWSIESCLKGLVAFNEPSFQLMNYNNTPPTASFIVSPTSGNINTMFVFDASSSSDYEDPTSSLEVRWDFDGNGVWDSDWDTEKIINFQFSEADTYNVKLEVKDSGDLTDIETKQVNVTSSGTTGEPCPGIPTITYEGKTYNTVQIGEQCWFKENLDFETGNSWCYDNNQSNCDTYGRLYDWETALGVCPSGWHLPSDEEWKILEGFVDSQFEYGDPEWNQTGWRGFDVGKNLKSSSGWSSNGNGLDLFGFSALPAGRKVQGGSFTHLEDILFIWTSSEDNSTYGWDRELYNTLDQSHRGTHPKGYGFSVRCLKD